MFSADPSSFTGQKAASYFVDYLRPIAEEQGMENIEETLNAIRSFFEERSATMVDV